MAYLPLLFLLSIGLLVPKPAMSVSLHVRASSRMVAAEKKIWTNEDIPLLRQAAPISIFADNSTAQSSTAEGAGAEVQSAPQPYVKERDPRWYAEQRQALQAQIDANEDQIREIQQIRETGDGISNAIPLYKEALGLSPEATVEILQTQVLQFEAQVEDLQDLARQNDMHPVVVH